MPPLLRQLAARLCNWRLLSPDFALHHQATSVTAFAATNSSRRPFGEVSEFENSPVAVLNLGGRINVDILQPTGLWHASGDPEMRWHTFVLCAGDLTT